MLLRLENDSQWNKHVEDCAENLNICGVEPLSPLCRHWKKQPRLLSCSQWRVVGSSQDFWLGNVPMDLMCVVLSTTFPINPTTTSVNLVNLMSPPKLLLNMSKSVESSAPCRGFLLKPLFVFSHEKAGGVVWLAKRGKGGSLCSCLVRGGVAVRTLSSG